MADLAAEFLALHVPGTPLLLPNPWDAGSARLLAGMGFRALATTSARVRRHPRPHRRQRHPRRGARPRGCRRRRRRRAGVRRPRERLRRRPGRSRRDRAAGGRRSASPAARSRTGTPSPTRCMRRSVAAERVAAAAEAAHGGERRLVLTARADGHLHGQRDPEDLDETIRRLQAYERGRRRRALRARGEQRRGHPPDRRVGVAAGQRAGPRRRAAGERLAELGVARVSTGSGLFWAAMGGLASAAEELRDRGTYAFWYRRRAAGRVASLPDRLRDDPRHDRAHDPRQEGHCRRRGRRGIRVPRRAGS